MEIEKVKLATNQKLLKDLNPREVQRPLLVSNNKKRIEEETESNSEFNVNWDFKWNFEVDKAETAVVGTMKLLPNIGLSTSWWIFW